MYTVLYRKDQQSWNKPYLVDREGLDGTEAIKADPRTDRYFEARAFRTVGLVAALSRDTRLFGLKYTEALTADGAHRAR